MRVCGGGGSKQGMDVLGIYSYITVIPILMSMPATKTSMFIDWGKVDRDTER